MSSRKKLFRCNKSSMILRNPPRVNTNSTPTLRPSQLIQATVNKINQGLNEDKKCIDLSNNSDSDEERLLIDDKESNNTSNSDSNDSFDSEDEDIDDSSIKKVKRKRVTDWWTQNFGKKVGDSSKVIELSDTEDNHEFEVISPKQKGRPIEVMEVDDDSNQMFQILDDIKICEDVEPMEISSHRKYSPKKSFKSKKTLKSKIESKTMKTKTNEKLFCFICGQTCDNSDSAKAHYLNHLGVFLECGECHQKFDSLQSYRKHDSQHLDRNKMLYLEDFMKAKLWSDHFVDYIERHDDLIQHYCQTNKIFCLVCHKIRQFFSKEINSQTFENSSKTKFDEEFVRNHLHQHFQYFPYECIDCRFEDKKTEFCLNRTARQHLQEVHRIDNAFDLKPNELKTYFDLKKSIKTLDFCIDYCFSLSSKMIGFWTKSGQKCDKRKIFSAKSQ